MKSSELKAKIIVYSPTGHAKVENRLKIDRGLPSHRSPSFLAFTGSHCRTFTHDKDLT